MDQVIDLLNIAQTRRGRHSGRGGCAGAVVQGVDGGRGRQAGKDLRRRPGAAGSQAGQSGLRTLLTFWKLLTYCQNQIQGDTAGLEQYLGWVELD